MTHTIAMLMILVLAAAATAVLAADGKSSPAPRVPVIVELYTSEGCSSCPPADALLKELAEKQPVDGALIIPLGLHVDYWNRLGWVDPFSSPQFSKRQIAFANGGNVYTPQMVVDGANEFVGSEREQALRAIADAAKVQKATIALESSWQDPTHLRVKLTAAKLTATQQVQIAITEQGLSTEVKRGENAGRKLEHAPVVRLLQSVAPDQPGSYQAVVEIPSSWERKNLQVIVFATDPQGRRIVAAGAAPVAGS